MGAGLSGTVPMTAGRVVAMIIGVPLLLIIIGWFALAMVSYAGQSRFRVGLDLPANGRAVQVAVDSGTLRIGPAAGSRLRVAGVARYSLIRAVVTRQVTPDAVRVVSRCQFSVLDCSFRYRVAVPAGSPVTLTDGHGPIVGAGLVNRIVSASDRSGNVALTFTAVPRRVTISDSLGDVTLVLPPGPAAYRIITRAPLGKTTIGVPTSPASRHVIAITDQSGSVTVSN